MKNSVIRAPAKTVETNLSAGTWPEVIGQQHMPRQIFIVIAVALLAACASKPPASIARIPPDDPGLTWVRTDIDRNIGTEVRWGGVISKVENKADVTWIEIVRYPLRDNGRPDPASLSDGRFIASFAGFRDPVVFKTGRALTVLGVVDGKVKRTIGEFEYAFPIVRVEGAHLWQAEPLYAAPVYDPFPPPWWYYDFRFRYGHPYHRHPRFW